MLKEYLKKANIAEIEEEVVGIHDAGYDEEKERLKFRQIYKSNVKSVTSYNVKDIQQQRTESFRENLDHSEFKKYMMEQQMTKEKAK